MNTRGIILRAALGALSSLCACVAYSTESLSPDDENWLCVEEPCVGAFEGGEAADAERADRATRTHRLSLAQPLTVTGDRNRPPTAEVKWIVGPSDLGVGGATAGQSAVARSATIAVELDYARADAIGIWVTPPGGESVSVLVPEGVSKDVADPHLSIAVPIPGLSSASPALIGEWTVSVGATALATDRDCLNRNATDSIVAFARNRVLSPGSSQDESASNSRCARLFQPLHVRSLSLSAAYETNAYSTEFKSGVVAHVASGAGHDAVMIREAATGQTEIQVSSKVVGIARVTVAAPFVPVLLSEDGARSTRLVPSRDGVYTTTIGIAAGRTASFLIRSAQDGAKLRGAYSIAISPIPVSRNADIESAFDYETFVPGYSRAEMQNVAAGLSAPDFGSRAAWSRNQLVFSFGAARVTRVVAILSSTYKCPGLSAVEWAASIQVRRKPVDSLRHTVVRHALPRGRSVCEYTTLNPFGNADIGLLSLATSENSPNWHSVRIYQTTPAEIASEYTPFAVN